MDVRYYEKNYKNYGKCACLETANILMMASLEFGPRIIYFGIKGEENILFEDTDRHFSLDVDGYGTWYTYGGHRLWRSPEIVPETYYPDNSPVNAEFSDGVLKLTAEPTPFGTQYSIEVGFGEDESLKVVNKILNCSGKPLRFAPWSITGLAAGGTEYIDLSTEDTGYLPNRAVVYWPYSKMKDERFDICDSKAVLRMDSSKSEAFKVGFNVVSGRAVYVKGNQTYTKLFDAYDKGAVYPDFGCNFETYTNGEFIECEVIGAQKDYAPGEYAQINETWIIKKN
ncbi:MAG: hypothetical protein MSH15_10845 [Oscillospiraceae bacterium]|nr:hypothetical protein [Oscillospiraceae bacterium]